MKQRWEETPKGKFSAQRATAKQRGIEFLFTFEEWWEMWEPHWEKRGCDRPDALQMCRNGDKGPYAPWNCRIDTLANNVKEAQANDS